MNKGKRFTGISIPVTSLRSQKSCGVGEFFDLILLGEWCAKTGVDLIQILPINDTGMNPSPYSALSAFALNPIYINLLNISNLYNDEILEFRLEVEKKSRLEYQRVYQFKMDILAKIFQKEKVSILENSQFQEWSKQNKWAREYAVFLNIESLSQNQKFCKKFQGQVSSLWLREEVKQPGGCITFGTRSRQKQLLTADDIEKYLQEFPEETYFYIWIQYELENQLLATVKSLEGLGIYLKGDIPILMGEDSADVLFYPNYFDRNYRAGAPPDMFSDYGQNWGFPVYNWQKLIEDDYSWWKKRLERFDKIFHAIRLDHVIGFLRIWQIPANDIRGAGGHFNPAAFFTEDSLLKEGFSLTEIKLLSSGIISNDNCYFKFGEHTERIILQYLIKLPNGYFTLNPSLNSEKDIEALQEEIWVKDGLKDIYFNRIFLKTENGFCPSWYYYRSEFLGEDKKQRVEEIIKRYYFESERIWEENGFKILSALRQCGDFLYCAEDLGAVPGCTHSILEKLDILSLKVGRWTRKYNEEGAPFILPTAYPYLSVVTTSVHDSSNLREWWEEDQDGREKLFSLLNLPGSCPDEFTIEVAEKVILFYLNANSKLCIFPLQDIFSLEQKYRTIKPSEERINLPGVVNETNWTYRMESSLESLLSDISFQQKVGALLVRV